MICSSGLLQHDNGKHDMTSPTFFVCYSCLFLLFKFLFTLICEQFCTIASSSNRPKCRNLASSGAIFILICQSTLLQYSTKPLELMFDPKRIYKSCLTLSIKRVSTMSKPYFKQLRRILLAVLARADKSLIDIFFCQHETSQTTLLHLPTAQESLFFFQSKICPPIMKTGDLWQLKQK